MLSLDVGHILKILCRGNYSKISKDPKPKPQLGQGPGDLSRLLPAVMGAREEGGAAMRSCLGNQRTAQPSVLYAYIHFLQDRPAGLPYPSLVLFIHKRKTY